MKGKYDVILADPPWAFSAWNVNTAHKHVSRQYPTMEMEDIASLPIKEITSENCVLFLWATWPKLRDTFQVLENWGFTYRTLAWVWVKSNKSGFGFFTGMGYYSRSNSEPCLLAVKGSMPVARHDIQALIYSPVRKHSQKPDDQYRKIEALYPNMKYLELFARRKRDGWDSWGNEIESDITL